MAHCPVWVEDELAVVEAAHLAGSALSHAMPLVIITPQVHAPYVVRAAGACALRGQRAAAGADQRRHPERAQRPRPAARHPCGAHAAALSAGCASHRVMDPQPRFSLTDGGEVLLALHTQAILTAAPPSRAVPPFRKLQDPRPGSAAMCWVQASGRAQFARNFISSSSTMSGRGKGGKGLGKGGAKRHRKVLRDNIQARASDESTRAAAISWQAL